VRPVAPPGSKGQLSANVVHFARILRGVGLPADPARVLDACRALTAVQITDRSQVYWALHAVFTAKPAHHELFDEAFRLFWRDPQGLDELLAALLPTLYAPWQEKKPDLSRRLTETLANLYPAPPRQQRPRETEV